MTILKVPAGQSFVNKPFAEALRPLGARLPRTVREKEILRVSAEVTCTIGTPQIPDIRRRVLTWVQDLAGSLLPRAAWEGGDYEHLAGGRNSAATRLQLHDTDIWAVRAEDPDKSIPGRTWITEFALGREGDATPKIGLRQFVSTTEDQLDIDPRPLRFLRDIADSIELSRGPSAVVPYSIDIDDKGKAEKLITLLLDENRALPVFVLTASEGNLGPLIDAEVIARDMLGLASVAVLPAEFTWLLTERVGKLRSVFGGAIRAYLPGFSEQCDAYSHRLELHDVLSRPNGAQYCRKWMCKLAADYSLRHLSLGREILDFKMVRTEALKLEQSRLSHNNASDSDRLFAAQRQNAALESQVKELNTELEYFDTEHKAAALRAQEAEHQLARLTYHVRQLTNSDRGRVYIEEVEANAPDKWSDLADWCEKAFIGRLILTQSARRGLRQPEFYNLAQVIRCLKWLASTCRDKRLEGGDGSLSNVLVEDSVWNTHCGEDAYECRFLQRTLQVDWHIKSGGNTRNPERCLRIYYSGMTNHSRLS